LRDQNNKAAQAAKEYFAAPQLVDGKTLNHSLSGCGYILSPLTRLVDWSGQPVCYFPRRGWTRHHEELRSLPSSRAKLKHIGQIVHTF
jgi:hypothetical protein